MDNRLLGIINRIDADIKEYGERLESLIITRKTLMSLYAMDDEKPVQAAIEHKPKRKPRKSFVITDEGRARWRATRISILRNILDNPNEFRTARDFITLFFGDQPFDKKNNDRIYGVLKELRDKNILQIGEDKRYSLTEWGKMHASKVIGDDHHG